jgi:hypothetical protein
MPRPKTLREKIDPRIACRRPWADLQRGDPVVFDHEDGLQLEGTARKVPSEPAGNDDRAVLLNRRERLRRVGWLMW